MIYNFLSLCYEGYLGGESAIMAEIRGKPARCVLKCPLHSFYASLFGYSPGTVTFIIPQNDLIVLFACLGHTCFSAPPIFSFLQTTSKWAGDSIRWPYVEKII